MFSITVLAMGKLKEKFYLEAAKEYTMRLGAYCKFQLLELPEYRLPQNPSDAEMQAGLAREAAMLRGKMPEGLLEMRPDAGEGNAVIFSRAGGKTPAVSCAVSRRLAF